MLDYNSIKRKKYKFGEKYLDSLIKYNKSKAYELCDNFYYSSNDYKGFIRIPRLSNESYVTIIINFNYDEKKISVNDELIWTHMVTDLLRKQILYAIKNKEISCNALFIGQTIKSYILLNFHGGLGIYIRF